MKHSLPLAGLIVLSLVCADASAAVISRDWMTPGDGLLTYDDVNQREWLDLSESRLPSFAGTTNSERYDTVLAEFAQHGFQAAGSGDLIALAQSAGIETATDDYSINAIETSTLISLVGVSSSFDMGASVYSFGWVDEFAPPNSLVGMLRVNPDSGPSGQAGLRIGPSSSSDLVHLNNTGVWLFRSAIPEPNTASLLVASCLFMRVLIHTRHP